MFISSVNNHLRVPAITALLGDDVVVFEHLVYSLATHFTRDAGMTGHRPYLGGLWCLETVVAPEQVTAFWYRLEDDGGYRVTNDMNGADEVVDAEVLSMAMNLIAMSNLSIMHYQDAEKVPRSAEDRERVAKAEQLSTAYSEMFHVLREHFFDRLEGQPTRSAALFHITD